MPPVNPQLAQISRLLDSLDIAFCLFSSDHRALLWNDAFLRFFPEHDGHVYAGEPYSENLRRFYRSRLSEEELPHIERYIAEGIERHQQQRRPFTFLHRGRRLRVASVPIAEIGRVRVWQEAATPGVAAPLPAGASEILPLDLLDHIADGATILDQDDRVLAANNEFRRLYHLAPHQSLTGMTLAQIVEAAWAAHPSRRPSRQIAMLDNMRFAGAPFEIELPGGEWRRVIARRTENGIGYFTHSDITTLKQQQRNLRAAEQRAREGEDRFRLLAENSSDVIVAMSAELVIRFVSPASRRLLGWRAAAMLGRHFLDFVHPDDRETFRRADHVSGGGVRPLPFSTCRILATSEDWIWMEASIGFVADRDPGRDEFAFVCTLRDARERVAAEHALQQAHAELFAMASTDGLTGVANRRRFDAAFDELWREAEARDAPLSILLVDVDHFKAVNDTFGHLVGDDCLRAVATDIRECLRNPTDLVARYGGEEFAVLLPDVGETDAVAIAERILARIRQRRWSDIAPGLAGVTVSLGCCSGRPGVALSKDGLLRGADNALYGAKRQGRDRVAVAGD